MVHLRKDKLTKENMCICTQFFFFTSKATVCVLLSGHAAARDNDDSGADCSRQASQNCAPHAVALPQSNLLCWHLAVRPVGRHALPHLHDLLGFRGEFNVTPCFPLDICQYKAQTECSLVR
jgi:hypothetical protein